MNVNPRPHVAPSSVSRPPSGLDPLREGLWLLGADPFALRPMARFPLALCRAAEASAPAHEGTPLQCLSVVRCGSLKCVRTMADGCAQLTALALPGDGLGLDGLHCGRHAATAVALETTYWNAEGPHEHHHTGVELASDTRVLRAGPRLADGRVADPCWLARSDHGFTRGSRVL